MEPVAFNKNLIAVVDNHGRPEGERCRYVALEGGSRSGKTHAALEYLASTCYQWAGCAVGVFRYDATRHTDGAMADLRAVLARMGMLDIVKESTQSKTFTWPNGATIKFRGTQDAQRAHGPAWDIVFFNEVMEVSLSTFNQIDQRTRYLVLLDWNPSLSHHWVFDNVLKQGPSKVCYVHSTFADNPHLEPEIVAKIRSYEKTEENKAAGTADSYMWDVYGLGRRGRREGVIFPNWATVAKWPDRFACERWGYGLDFGFSQDPTALIECALFQDSLFLREVIYERGLIVGTSRSSPHTPSVEGMMAEAGIDRRAKVYGDSAAAESLEVLRLAGYNVIPADKSPVGHKSGILHGIDLIRSFDLYVHEDSINIQRELENYTWARDRAGVWTSEPIDDWNHAIDAVRYWAREQLKPRQRHGGPPPRPQQAQTTLSRW